MMSCHRDIVTSDTSSIYDYPFNLELYLTIVWNRIFLLICLVNIMTKSQLSNLTTHFPLDTDTAKDATYFVTLEIFQNYNGIA